MGQRPGRFEHVQRAHGVDLEDVLGIAPRLTHMGPGGQVVDGVGRGAPRRPRAPPRRR